MREFLQGPGASCEIKWLFLDLNSYFASVEQQLNPYLRGKPVAVLPMMTDGTCAIAASYEAKKYGVRTGTKVYDAKKMCPGLICVPARHDKYVEYHHKILEEVVRHTPINKVWSIDELSSRLPPNKRNEKSAVEIATRIREGIWERVGTAINCSIGFAPNAYLAKIATNLMKPKGLVILKASDLPGPLFNMKLRDFPGIGERMEENLFRRGIRTVEQFWNLSPKQARAIWGSVEGERFWYNMHGFEVPTLETAKSVLGHSRMLEPDLRAPDTARLIARRLTIKAASRLRRAGLYATSFDVSFRTEDQQGWGASTKMSPAQDNFAFLKALDDLWDGLMQTYRPRRLKKVSINLHGLCEQNQITPDLFDTSSQEFQNLQKRSTTISDMMDKINQKFGAETLRLGVSPQSEAGYVGTKIAFSRIPDAAEFYE